MYSALSRNVASLASLVVMVLFPALCLLAGASAARAQAPGFAWQPGFHVAGIAPCGEFCPQQVWTSAVFNDGSGPALYVGGSFVGVGFALSSNVARYDSVRGWVGVGAGLPAPVTALEPAPTAAGDRLFAVTGPDAQALYRVSAWDGTQWTDRSAGLPSDVPINDLAFYSDPGGTPALYAALGDAFSFSSSPGRIFRFNGATWTELPGQGLQYAASRLFVDRHPDGTAELVCGTALFSCPASLGRIYRVAHPAPGTAWTQLGAEVPFGIRGIDSYEGELYVGGSGACAPVSGGVRVLRADQWQSVSDALVSQGWIYDLRVLSVDGQLRLVAAGQFQVNGPTHGEHLAAWDGAVWTPLFSQTSLNFVYEPDVFNVNVLPGSDDLVACGDFTAVEGVPAWGLAFRRAGRWDAAVPRGDGFIGRGGSALHVTTALESHGEPRLLGAGFRATAGAGEGPGIYTLIGGVWMRTGTLDAIEDVTEFATIQTPQGPELYAAGFFGYNPSTGDSSVIVKWDGTDWRQHTTRSCSPICSDVNVLIGFQGTLFAGGEMYELNHVSMSTGVAQYVNGAWTSVPNSPRNVQAMAVADFGSGPQLYAAGNNRLSRWTSTTWVDVTSVNGLIYAMRTVQEAGGTRIYVGGEFSQIGSVNFANIARFNGNEWSALGTGINGRVNDLEIFDDGTGPALFAGGDFTLAGGTSARSVARFNGTAWSAVDIGIQGKVIDLQAFTDDHGPALYATGFFGIAGDVISVNVAKYARNTPACPPDWNHDGNLDSQDFFDFLSGFFAGAADYDGNGATNSADFFAFITAYLTGCGG